MTKLFIVPLGKGKSDMEREQIIKALECCSDDNAGIVACFDCHYSGYARCGTKLVQDAIALIRELTADVERVSKQCAEIIIECDERDAIRLRQVGEYAAKVKELTEENERLRAEVDERKEIS